MPTLYLCLVCVYAASRGYCKRCRLMLEDDMSSRCFFVLVVEFYYYHIWRLVFTFRLALGGLLAIRKFSPQEHAKVNDRLSSSISVINSISKGF